MAAASFLISIVSPNVKIVCLHTDGVEQYKTFVYKTLFS